MVIVAGIFKVHWSSYSSALLTALLKTIEFTAAGFVGAVLLGLAMALMRLSPLRLMRFAAALYTELVKNVPLLAIIFSCSTSGFRRSGWRLASLKPERSAW